VIRIKRIVIETIPHNTQRYDTIGDWAISDDGTLRVAVSELGDHRMSMACGIHEAIEAMLCNLDEVSEARVTEFDEDYEAARQAILANAEFDPARVYRDKWRCTCEITAGSEPGEDRHAPYRLQHAFADGIERLVAMELGVIWSEYSDKIAALEYRGNDASSQTQKGREEIKPNGEISDARDEAREAAQRVEERPEGQEP
jgi:hypothetical protein